MPTDKMAQADKSGAALLQNISPTQRAAIVIAMLGEEFAKPIIEQLDDSELSNIASGLDALSLLGKDELAEVVVDFLGHLRNTSGGFVSGKASTRDMVSNIMSFRTGTGVLAESGDAEGNESSATENVPRDVWKTLEGFPLTEVAEYLDRLTPNLVAIVLNKLPVTMASEVFDHLADDKLQPVMKHMVEATELDPRVENVVSRMIEIEFLNANQDTSDEGKEHLAGIGEMLSLMPSGKRESLVKFLEADHASKINDIQGALFTIDSLPDTLPRSAVPVIFREMDTGEIVDLLSTLQKDEVPVFEFLMGNISSRLADQLKDKLSSHKELSSEAVEVSQRNFLMRIMALKRSGDIEI